MGQVPSGDCFQPGGLQSGSDELVRRWYKPRSAADLTHLSGHEPGHDALYGDVGATCAAAAILGIQVAAKFLDEFLYENTK